MHKPLVVWLGLFLAPDIALLKGDSPHEESLLFALVEGVTAPVRGHLPWHLFAPVCHVSITHTVKWRQFCPEREK